MNRTPEQMAEIEKWANLGQALLSDKRTKSAAEKLVKQIAPEIETSEDLAEPLLAPMRAQLEDVKGQLKGIMDGAAAYNEEQKFASLRTTGYTDDGIGKIKDIMKAKGISDPEVAAAVFDKTNPPAPARVAGVSPQNYGNDLFGIDGDKAKERLELLFNNQDAFIEETVREIANEFNNQ